MLYVKSEEDWMKKPSLLIAAFSCQNKIIYEIRRNII
jgi:hypothetical protein